DRCMTKLMMLPPVKHDRDDTQQHHPDHPTTVSWVRSRDGEASALGAHAHLTTVMSRRRAPREARRGAAAEGLEAGY
ncbi:MAG: hypothetical protein ABL886_08380, partial [Rhodoglobus sp.]